MPGGERRSVRLTPDKDGYVSAYLAGVGPGAKYGYRLDNGNVMPDPASHRQPDGELGLSEVVDHNFKWTDGKWKGRALSEMNITETHVGTATPGKNFNGLRKDVHNWADDTIELMPLHQFFGRWNWGYDPAQLSAVHNTYGTPKGLKRLVDAAHDAKKAMIVDVVYNHPGPRGAFAGAFGPYFEGGSTPWGRGVNIDGAPGREVTRLFVENMLMWFNEYRMDGARFDATVFIPQPLLEELSQARDQLSKVTGRKYVLISENNRNNNIVTKPVNKGGHGFDAQWSMDLQYALRALLNKETGWRIDRYTDAPFSWALKAIARGWAYEGQKSPFPGDIAENPTGHFGTSAAEVPVEAIVVAKDDHDQIGNTPAGERLGNRVGAKLDRAVDALFGFLPFTVMKFQGDDYRAPQPFDFVVDPPDGDPLGQQITEGRNREWALWLQGREFRDPVLQATYEGMVLNPAVDRTRSPHREAFTLAQELLALRQKHPVFKHKARESYEVVGFEAQNTILQRRWAPGGKEVIALTNFSEAPVTIDLAEGGRLERTGAADVPRRDLNGSWKVLLNTEDPRFGGGGSGMQKGESVNFNQSTTITVAAGSALYLERGS